MKTDSTFSPDESMQEIILRAALHEHVPVDIDVDSAWANVSQRLSANTQYSVRFTINPRFASFSGKRRSRVSLKGRMIVVAVAVVTILIAGINILFPLLPGSGSVVDAKQYQQIGISQSLNGITITADKGYASSAGIVIAYHVQPSHALMKNLTAVLLNTSIVKDRTGQSMQLLRAVAITCGSSDSYGWPLRCYIQMVTPHPLVTSKKLELTWDVTDAILVYHTPPLSRTSISIKGHWHFHITLDFHSGHYMPAYNNQI